VGGPLSFATEGDFIEVPADAEEFFRDESSPVLRQALPTRSASVETIKKMKLAGALAARLVRTQLYYTTVTDLHDQTPPASTSTQHKNSTRASALDWLEANRCTRASASHATRPTTTPSVDKSSRGSWPFARMIAELRRRQALSRTGLEQGGSRPGREMSALPRPRRGFSALPIGSTKSLSGAAATKRQTAPRAVHSNDSPIDLA